VGKGPHRATSRTRRIASTWWLALPLACALLSVTGIAGFATVAAQHGAEAAPAPTVITHTVITHTVATHTVATRQPSPALSGGRGSIVVPSPPAGWTTRVVSMVVQGRSRYYLVARPTTITTPSLPVLIVLHGRNMTPAAMVKASGFLSVVGQAVVVYPAGLGESWNAGYCCGKAHSSGVDDVAFIDAVMRSVLATQPGTSANLVYLAGFSNGGRMAYRMACADPDAFAGVAAVEAVAVSTCTGSHPVPLVEIASTGDPLLTLSDRQEPKMIAGHEEVTVQSLMTQWRVLEGCRTSTTASSFPAMTITEWTRCGPGGRVSLVEYQGGHHAWPRGGPGTPSAQTVIWGLFRDRPIGEGGVPTSRPSPLSVR